MQAKKSRTNHGLASVQVGVALLVGFFFACASQSRPKAIAAESQSYAEAIRLMCDVDVRASVSPQSDELEQSRQREDYIVEHTKNGDAIYFATIWRTKPPSEQSQMLAEQAKSQGLSSCPLADVLRER